MHTHSAVPTAIYIAMGTATRQQSKQECFHLLMPYLSTSA